MAYVFRPERTLHNNPPQRGGDEIQEDIALKGQCLNQVRHNVLRLNTIPTIALSGRLFGVLPYPPRCGGLLCNVLSGRNTCFNPYNSLNSYTINK
jgi:hypothetical protein